MAEFQHLRLRTPRRVLERDVIDDNGGAERYGEIEITGDNQLPSGFLAHLAGNKFLVAADILNA